VRSVSSGASFRTGERGQADVAVPADRALDVAYRAALNGVKLTIGAKLEK
jgi:hypothetical protein